MLVPVAVPVPIPVHVLVPEDSFDQSAPDTGLPADEKPDCLARSRVRELRDARSTVDLSRSYDAYTGNRMRDSFLPIRATDPRTLRDVT